MDENEELTKKYLLEGGQMYRVTEIDRIRDGGTNVIFTSDKNKTFYVPKDGYTIHSGIPCTDDNHINDSLVENYLMDRMKSFISLRRVMLEQSVDLLWDLEHKPKSRPNTQPLCST